MKISFFSNFKAVIELVDLERRLDLQIVIQEKGYREDRVILARPSGGSH